MYRKDFVKKTISSLNPTSFERLKDVLNSEHYIPFDFIDADKVDEHALEEKISDYFEKVELLAGGKRFDYLIEQYAENLDSVVNDYISGIARSVKGGSQTDSRAKNYYDKANDLRKTGLKSFDAILDYSRIMLCLYMAIINNKHRHISNFEYSSECLDRKGLIDALKNEKVSILLGEKRRFDTHSPYRMDRCTFIIVIIMCQYIKSKEVEAED